MGKPTRSRDGRLRVTVRVAFRLDLYELTCAAALAWHPDDKPTVALVRKAVTGHMTGHGEYPGMEYGDQVRDDYDGELEATYNMLKPHVARAFGFPKEESDE